MMAEKRLSEKQVKWMLVSAFAASALALAVVAGIASAQDANENSEGKRVYDHWCSHCHDPGQGHPGTQGLQIKYRDTDTPAVLLERTDLTPPVIATFVRQGVLAMAPFRKTEITDAELDALAAYLSD
jgi:mono/diheme cytochrome c family protein